MPDGLSLFKKKNSKKYVIYGAGNRARRVLRVLKNTDIAFITDEDITGSTAIDNKDYACRPVKDMAQWLSEDIEIIVSSAHKSDVLSLLESSALSCRMKMLTRKTVLADSKSTFGIYILSFTDANKTGFSIHHDFKAIPAQPLAFLLGGTPCAVILDSVSVNGKEARDYSSVISTNGKWISGNAISFAHCNPAVYIDSSNGIKTISAQLRYGETDYKEAFKFMKGLQESLADVSGGINPEFVPEEDAEPVVFGDDDVKPVAFYLPQFHQIPQNDEWWEKGFTEWTNVTKSYPLFEGHLQPNLPIDMGFYDLSNINIQKRQIELARKYGIYGFCYYYYHFEGTVLLEMPLARHLQNKELDLPFCIFYANEEWTKRWVGDESGLLSVGQGDGFLTEVIQNLAKYLKDPRYIRIDGKPVITVYRPGKFKNPERLPEIWRGYCRREGIGEIYLMYVGFDNYLGKPPQHGYDGINNFIQINAPPDESHKYGFYEYSPQMRILSYDDYVNTRDPDKNGQENVFKTTLVNYDNSPRYGGRAEIYHGASPALYKGHTLQAISYTKRNHAPQNRYMFIFAWNEWAESAYLEPDRRFGYARLKATREAVLESR